MAKTVDADSDVAETVDADSDVAETVDADSDVAETVDADSPTREEATIVKDRPAITGKERVSGKQDRSLARTLGIVIPLVLVVSVILFALVRSTGDEPDTQALTEQDPETQVALYQEAEVLILDDVPWFPLFFDRFHVLVKPYVKNYHIPQGIVPRLRFVTLEDDQ